jgi:hypothetical protein
MGLMDRVKAQAQVLAQQTKDAAEQGRARLDQAQARGRGDLLLRQLGAAVYADRTGRGTPDSQAKIEQLINDISAHERENGLNLTAEPTLPPQSTVPPQPTFRPDPSSPYPGGQPVNEYGPSPFGGQGGGPAQTSFPDSGSSFPGSGAPSAPESGGTTAFPPEG